MLSLLPYRNERNYLYVELQAMTPKQITVTVIVATTAIIIGYDCYAVLVGGIDATVSEIIWTNAKEYPIIAFGAGLLCGHLFWQTKR